MIQIWNFLFRNSAAYSFKKIVNIASRQLSRSADNHSAGLIIIGDEILKSQVKDTNSYFMCTLLYECGIKVEKISVIRDDVDIIANEIFEFSGKYKYVITSGGIGPTHDDMTFEGLAKAFNDSLHYHPWLFDIIRELYKTEDKSSPAFKMANIPKSSSLSFGKNQETGKTLNFPCVNVKNVYVFPGSPIYLEPLFQSLYKDLFTAPQTFVKNELYIDAKEELFANALSKVSKEFSNVAFGSYPVTDQCYYKARVTIESDNEDTTSKAKARFISLVPPDVLVDYDKSPEINALDKFNNLLQVSEYSDKYSSTYQQIKKIFEEPERVAIAFDGSIESTVLIHFAHIVLKESNKTTKINSIIFKSDEEFYPEAKTFIKEISIRYNLHVKTLDTSPETGVEMLKAHNSNIKLLLLGIKSDNKLTGIYHKLRRETKLPIDIECPLIGWTVDSLWTFAKFLSLPYCTLYDKGFTCIGGRLTTKENPKLILNKEGNRTIYQSAWKLKSQ